MSDELRVIEEFRGKLHECYAGGGFWMKPISTKHAERILKLMTSNTTVNNIIKNVQCDCSPYCETCGKKREEESAEAVEG